MTAQSSTLPRPPAWLPYVEFISRIGGRPRDFKAGMFASAVALEENSFESALDSFCRAFEGKDSLTFLGRRAVRFMIRSALERRRRIEEACRLDSEIQRIPVERPIFVVGPPRTGTTLLQSLLLQDEGCRWLRPWELELAYPKEQRSWGGPDDRRRIAFDRNVAKMRKQAAAINSIHPIDSPAECWQLLWASFACHTIFLFFGLGEAYESWADSFAASSTEPAYRFYKLQLQHLLRMQSGSHWVLKAPEHLLHVQTIFEVFPDATVVQLHRDPAEFVPSLCSLACHCQYLSVREYDPLAIGSQVMKTMERWQAQNFAQREGLANDRVIDIEYQDLVNHPAETVWSIYERSGRKPTAGMEKNVRDWLAAHHGAGRPRHTYSLGEFGLDSRKVREALNDYRLTLKGAVR